MHENLIDQTHFPFLHPDTVGTPEYARLKLTASTENNQVVIKRALHNSPPPGVYGKPADIMYKTVDRTLRSAIRLTRPARAGDAAIDAFLLQASAQAYSEDVEALEWIMAVVRNDADPQIDLSFALDPSTPISTNPPPTTRRATPGDET